MKKEDAYNQDEFVHDVLDFLVEYNKEVKQFIDNFIELRKRVDKAIEYIENNTYEKGENECGYTSEWDIRELYDILKGSDK